MRKNFTPPRKVEKPPKPQRQTRITEFFQQAALDNTTEGHATTLRTQTIRVGLRRSFISNLQRNAHVNMPAGFTTAADLRGPGYDSDDNNAQLNVSAPGYTSS